MGLVGCSLLFTPSAEVHDDAGSTNHDSGSANGDAGAGTDCPANYTLLFEGSRYRLASGVLLSWYQAQTACEEEETHLVVVDSQAEAEFLNDLDFVGWIGATDHQDEATFRWVTGPSLEGAYQRWGLNQPDDLFGTQDCVKSTSDGYLWEDFNCTAAFAYVCECDAQPLADTWCVTGTDTDCDICGDSCLPRSCANSSCTF